MLRIAPIVVLLALAIPAAAEPAYDTSSCASCHAQLTAGKKDVHNPVKNGTCSDCHVPSKDAGKCGSPVAKAWSLAQDSEAKLCNSCHPQKGSSPRHPVIEKAGCTPCHDPHASDNPSLLTEFPVAKLCEGCHSAKDKKKSVHTPVQKGDCLGCHDPHIGEAAPLLIESPKTLCLSCHKQEALAKDRFKHAPVVEGQCLGCHDPHSSDHPKQTVAEGKDLCLKCHAQNAPTRGLASPGPAMRVDLSRKDVHNAVKTGQCQDCHVAGHSSANPKLLAKSQPDLCYGCHSKTKDPFVHGAVKVGDCSGCHDPHSAQEQGLLRAPAGSALCFRCHEDDVTGRPVVHKPVAEGKCLDCHDAHSNESPFNIANDCSSCHKDVVKGKQTHAAITRYGCTACHDPHGAQNRTLLIKGVNALCTSCHTDKTDGAHVTSGGHRVAGGPDTHEPDKDFSCVSCHSPHGSDSPKLLRYGKTSMEACDWCHGDRTGDHPELKDIHRVQRPKKPVNPENK